MEHKTRILTVAGKGGVGKTSICASIVRLLVEKYPDRKILAIDADPAVGLSTALGVDVKLTLDDIRMSIVDSVENGATREALELCAAAGILSSHIIAMQGPFTRAFNAALYDQWGIRAMVTKDSGQAGGVEEKVIPALERQIHIIMIDRPKEE